MSAAAGGPVAVHQFIPTLNPHDATGTHTLKLRDALRAAGWRSEIFAEAIHDDLAARGLQALDVPRARGRRATSPSTSSRRPRPWRGYLAEHGLPLILDFHNFTGPEYFAGWEPAQRGSGRPRAADELALLAPEALLGLAKSRFSERELRRAGCRRTAVVPVLADYGRVTATPDPRVAAELARLARRRRRRHPLRRPGRALQGTARAGQGAVGLPAPLRRPGPTAPRRRHVELRVLQGAARVRRTTSA